jgi:succinate dehydrogenase / fumarate reductase cytochrome b subunit
MGVLRQMNDVLAILEKGEKMEDTKNADRIIRRRELLSLSEWRSTQVGMWAWLIQRVSALLIIILIALHLVYPYMVSIQAAMVFFVFLHAALGLRVIFLDLGTDTALHKTLFYALIALALVLFVIVLKYRIFYF